MVLLVGTGLMRNMYKWERGKEEGRKMERGPMNHLIRSKERRIGSTIGSEQRNLLEGCLIF